MASVLGAPLARAPRTSRTKSLQAMLPKSAARLQNHAGEQGVASLNNASEVISFLETFVEHIQNACPEKEIQSTIVTLCSNLKVYGPQLETLFKDQLDQAFIHLRNASRDEKLDKFSRLHLLEVVELRAGRWVSQDPQGSGYYQRKLAEVEEINLSSDTTSSSLVPSSPSSVSASTSGQQKTSSPPPVTPPPLFLQPVNPGAKERLVQITGAAEDNIERARQLMEETIVRNASPVPNAESSNEASGFGDGGAADGAADGAANGAANGDEASKGGGFAKNQSRRQSVMEAALSEFRYTVNVADQMINITGQNLDLVRISKIVLDDYFSNLDGGRLRTVSNCSIDDGVVMSQDSPRSTVQPAEGKRVYKREYLILWSSSPLCKLAPPNFESIVHAAPEIVRKVSGN